MADEFFHATWENEHKTPPTRVLTQTIFEDLGIHLFDEELSQMNTIFERSLLDGPPRLSDGIESFLARHDQDFKFAIISDTQFSPGQVIKEYLDHKGIGKYFDFHAFSDEVGKSKPDIAVFNLIRERFGFEANQCLHVGDLLRTDIKGANMAGWISALYTGIRADDFAGPVPNYVCNSWDELSLVLTSDNK